MKIDIDEGFDELSYGEFGHWKSCVFIYSPMESGRMQGRHTGEDRELLPELDYELVFVPREKT